MAMSIFVLVCMGAGGGAKSSNGSFVRSLVLCSAPALIYVAQNTMNQMGITEVDATTFNCLNQTKIIATAIALFLIRGVRQSRAQMAALILLSVGGMLLSIKPGQASGASGATGAAAPAATTGILLILGASGLSGVAATLTQIFMQDMAISPYMLTLCMCLVSIVTILAGIAAATPALTADLAALLQMPSSDANAGGWGPGLNALYQTSLTTFGDYAAGWNALTWIPVGES